MASAPAPPVSNPARSPAAPGARSAPDPWLFGPTADLLLGCGGLYAIFLAVAAVGGEAFRQAQPVYLFPLCALLFSTPHYGATILRVYEQRRERRAYALFSVWATGALCALFVLGVHHPPTLAVLLTVYMTWSPWHYTGQNFGLSVLFLRRRGIDPGVQGRRWLHTSFTTSYALTFLVMHGRNLRGNDSPLAYSGAQIPFLSLELPAAFVGVALPLTALVYLGSTVAAGFFLLQRARAAALLPSFFLVLTQGLWFTFPLLLTQFEVTTGLFPIDRHYTDFFFWAAIGHAVQYLWITSWTARSDGDGPAASLELPRYLGKTLLAGLALFTLPIVVFGPDALGRFSFTAGLGILLTAVINIHHFMLDGAIWKLRNPTVRALLLREGSHPSSDAERSWVGPLAWTLAAASVPIAVFAFVTEFAGYSSAFDRGQLADASKHLDRLAWVGRDNEMHRAALGRAWLARNDFDEAARQLERRAELNPTPDAWIELADLYKRADRPTDVVRSAEIGISADPQRPYLYMRAAQAELELGDRESARTFLERGLEQSPKNPVLEAELRKLERLGPRTRKPDSAEDA